MPYKDPLGCREDGRGGARGGKQRQGHHKEADGGLQRCLESRPIGTWKVIGVEGRRGRGIAQSLLDGNGRCPWSSWAPLSRTRGRFEVKRLLWAWGVISFKCLQGKEWCCSVGLGTPQVPQGGKAAGGNEWVVCVDLDFCVAWGSTG